MKLLEILMSGNAHYVRTVYTNWRLTGIIPINKTVNVQSLKDQRVMNISFSDITSIFDKNNDQIWPVDDTSDSDPQGNTHKEENNLSLTIIRNSSTTIAEHVIDILHELFPYDEEVNGDEGIVYNHLTVSQVNDRTIQLCKLLKVTKLPIDSFNVYIQKLEYLDLQAVIDTL